MSRFGTHRHGILITVPGKLPLHWFQPYNGSARGKNMIVCWAAFNSSVDLKFLKQVIKERLLIFDKNLLARVCRSRIFQIKAGD